MWDQIKENIVPAIVGVVIMIILIVVGFAVYSEITEAKSGTIYEKQFHPAYYSTSCTDSRDAKGNITGHNCTSTYWPECYEVNYKNTEGKTGNACVTALEYDRYKTGDHYPAGE